VSELYTHIESIAQLSNNHREVSSFDLARLKCQITQKVAKEVSLWHDAALAKAERSMSAVLRTLGIYLFNLLIRVRTRLQIRYMATIGAGG
jgi:hypothetical protein